MTEIFVFGSNTWGRHGKGAALTARKKHGAVYGQGVGRTGNAYAIPTKDGETMKVLPLGEIKNHVSIFLSYAAYHRELTFEVTAIGTGLAGYSHEEIAPMFKGFTPNCRMPKEWEKYLRTTSTSRSASCRCGPMVKRNPYREKRARKAPSLSVQVAACLIKLGFVDRKVAAGMDVKAILRLAEWDHGNLHALGGSDHPSNYYPVPPWEHAEKSKVDAGIVAKHDRILPDQIESAVKLEAKRGVTIRDGDKVTYRGVIYTYRDTRAEHVKKKQKIKSRGFPSKEERARMKQLRSASKTKADNA